MTREYSGEEIPHNNRQSEVNNVNNINSIHHKYILNMITIIHNILEKDEINKVHFTTLPSVTKAIKLLVELGKTHYNDIALC